MTEILKVPFNRSYWVVPGKLLAGCYPGSEDPIEEKRNLEHRLIFGYYPEVVVSESNPERILRLLADSFLYKDHLMLEEIKKPLLLSKILRVLALQIGNEVSYTRYPIIF